MQARLETLNAITAGGRYRAPARRFVFVLEQTLGHKAHSQNLERSLGREAWIDPTVIHVGYRERRHIERLPGLGSWTVRASRDARRAVRKRMAVGEVDALFIHTQVSAVMAAGLMKRVPTVVSMDATPANVDELGAAYGHERDGRIREGLKRALNARTFSSARALVTWSRWARDSLVSDYGIQEERIRVIRPGVDLDIFRPGGPRPHHDRLRVLFVGGDFDRKGGQDLLRAATPFADRLELDIVTSAGTVEVPPGLVCRLHHGLEPQSPALVALYRRADAFVLPTYGDCLGLAILEAQACGLPVVATRVGAIPELVTHGIDGYLVPPGAPGLLSECLAQLIARPWQRWEMGAAGLEKAQREYDARRNNSELFDLMNEVAS